MNQKLTLMALVMVGVVGMVGRVEGGLQFGLGAGAFKGTEFDEEVKLGLVGEFGVLFDDAPIDLFLGPKFTYVNALSFDRTGSAGFATAGASADLDLFESVLAVRVLFPLGTESIKLYAEGTAGVANLSVSGETSARAEIGGREFSFNRRLDADAWVFAWGLAAGVQFDFTGNFGLRAGYEFHGLGDADMFDLKSSTGNMHGVSAALLLKF